MPGERHDPGELTPWSITPVNNFLNRSLKKFLIAKPIYLLEGYFKLI